MATQSVAKGKISDILIEFLEIAFNAVLFSRKIYPSTIFVQKKKYGVPVRIATHPGIKKYILECLKTTKQLYEWGSLRHVAVVISDKTKPLERYVFELLPGPNISDHYHIGTEEAFRVYLLRLSVSGSSLPPLPEDCCFSIELATTAQTSVQLSDSASQAHFPWLEVEKSSVPIESCVVVPLKTLETERLALQMYIECNG